ncbi:MAG: putative nucleotide sugar epimerase, partial [Phycisphaerales bacterium]|nr:putative nucleotide sugar epimerase [Phycisphaerales bacterium]
RDHPALRLRVIATGMHLDRSRGYSVAEVRRAGLPVDATVPWRADSSPAGTAAAMGRATAGLVSAYEKVGADVVLVVGDRVEAFAAAAAAHVAGRCVAHVHGGDRALGQVDDALRHAITKLAHVHFPATAASATRLLKLGEDRWRIHRVGSPGIDGIAADAASPAAVAAHVGPAPDRRFALIALHPTTADARTESARAESLLGAVIAKVGHAVVVHPNNDPGSDGIAGCWDAAERTDRVGAGPRKVVFHRNLPRPIWLGLLRDAAVLVGNSSSGIIEAASFGTPVVDVGPRQQGREHGPNVVNVRHDPAEVRRAVLRFWRAGRPVRFPRRNVYGGAGTGRRIAAVLAELALDERMLRKLITY